jgi:hypothetical protein
MKTIIRRLRMLEERFGPQVTEEGERPVALVRPGVNARHKQRASRMNRCHEEISQGRTVVEILRSGLSNVAEERKSEPMVFAAAESVVPINQLDAQVQRGAPTHSLPVTSTISILVILNTSCLRSRPAIF